MCICQATKKSGFICGLFPFEIPSTRSYKKELYPSLEVFLNSRMDIYPLNKPMGIPKLPWESHHYHGNPKTTIFASAPVSADKNSGQKPTAEGIYPLIIVPTWVWTDCSFNPWRPSHGSCWADFFVSCILVDETW